LHNFLTFDIISNFRTTQVGENRHTEHIFLYPCPRLLFPKFLMGFCSDRSCGCAYKTWSW